MCLACEQEALYYAYLKQMAARAAAQDPLAKAKQFSADAVEEDTDPVIKPGADEPL
ncbi:MAG: hypothetical protein ACLPKB_11550 [Xanthobacteraceae bacterium]